jgi:hypothetical protein
MVNILKPQANCKFLPQTSSLTLGSAVPRYTTFASRDPTLKERGIRLVTTALGVSGSVLRLRNDFLTFVSFLLSERFAARKLSASYKNRINQMKRRAKDKVTPSRAVILKERAEKVAAMKKRLIEIDKDKKDKVSHAL